ncbi:MAG: aquaporin [Abditibacteriota bacterium]|jgi:aquaporin NIP|nr:aquaporin [Abditibacteriota bacterium]
MCALASTSARMKTSGSKYFAEAFGTFALVFAGTGAIIINDLQGGAVSHVGVALTFGLIVMAMIYALGDVSGAHFNPAVTLAFWFARRLPAREVLPYIVSQCGGALLASLLLRFLFVHPTLGATIPAHAIAQSFVLEIVLTCVLMFVILCVSCGARESGLMAGAAIGATVGLEALFAGPISGASMNPARSLAPALVSGHFAVLWVYLLAPVLGALMAVSLCRCARGSDCCGAAA